LKSGSTVKVDAMDENDTAATDPHAPNHHAHHRSFDGLFGVVGALSMVVGRGEDAALAAELIRLRAGDRLVDVGCGPGPAARHAAGLGAEVIGVDPAPVMVLVARMGDPRGRIDLRLGAAESLPVADGWASAVWTLASVHHWADVDAGIAEALRVLAPGGRLLAMERRIEPGATGHGSHGWRDEQAASFARRCEAAGFAHASVHERPGRRGASLAVLAERAG
jgi:SAM-dependent methyltransferase